MEELRKLLSHTAVVLREGERIEVDARDIIEGDIIILTAGDIVPADIRLLETRNLSANESI